MRVTVFTIAMGAAIVAMLIWESCGGGKAAGQGSRTTNEVAPIVLQLAVVADAQEPTLFLTATNVSGDARRIPEFGQKGNAIRVTSPDGRSGEEYAAHGEPIERTALKAGESKCWEFNAGSFMRKAGTYAFSWRVDKWKTADVIYVRKTDKREVPPIPGPPVASQPG